MALLLNVFVPFVIWTLAVANMLVVVWPQSGWQLVASLTMVSVIAIGSFYALTVVTEKLRVTTSIPVRVLFYALLFGGTVAASFDVIPPWPWFEQSSVEPVPPITERPATIASEDSPLLPPGPRRLETVPANVVELIPMAQQMLASRKLDVEQCGGRGDGQPQCVCDYLLVVSDKDGDMTFVEAYQERESVPEGYKVNVLEYAARYERSCGTNPVLDVSHPPGQTVLAIRTVVKTYNGQTEAAVFTPYTDELNIPELRERGLDYWWEAVTTGRDQLVASNTTSKFRTSDLIPDVIPAMTVFTIGIIENIGNSHPFGSKGSDLDRLRELNSVLVMFGANRENTFDWRVSSANGRGVLQIVDTDDRDTFENLRKWYPEANIPVYRDTVTDHLASIRYAYLHLDEELRPLSKTNRVELPKQALLFGLYSAAGYNGKATRANAALQACTEAEWYSGTCVKLHSESIDYVQKYLGVYPMLTAPSTIERLQEEFKTE